MGFIKRSTLRPRRRLLAWTLCLTLTVLCCLSPAAEATNVGTSLTVGIQSTKTTTISPLYPLERDMMSIYGLVYESLVTIDDDYLPAPAWRRAGKVQRRQDLDLSPAGKRYFFRWHAAHRQ